MFINSIAATAFKGRSFSFALSPATIIAAGNFKGKTSTIQAIQLAILGFIPGRPKNSRDAFPNGSVKITFDDGEHLARKYTSKGGRVSEEIDTSLFEADIESLATPTLDAAEYFAKGPTERIQYIFEHMSLPDTHTVAGIMADIENGNFDDHDPAFVRAAFDEVSPIVRDSLNGSIAEGLARLTGERGTISVELSRLNKRVKETQGAIRIAAEIKLRANECSAETVDGIKALLETNQVALSQAQKSAGALTERQMAANRSKLRRKELTEALASEPTSHEEDIAAYKKSIEEDREAQAVFEAELKAPAPNLETADSVCAQLRTEVGAARERASALLAERTVIEGDLREIGALTECPKCGAKSKGWKSRWAISTQKSLETCVDKFNEASKEHATLIERLAKASEIAERRRVVVNAIDGREKSIITITREIERLQSADLLAKRQRAQLQKELESLSPDQGFDESGLESVAIVQRDLEAENKDLNERLQVATRLQHEISQAAQAEIEHVKAKASAAVYDHVKKKLKHRQATTIDTLFQGLMDKANYFTQGILDSPLVFRDGEVGRIIGQEFISHEDFSGCEKGLTYVAVAAALAGSAPFKLAIIDEVKIDEENTVKILARLSDAVTAGIINQALVIDTVARELPGWSTVVIGKEAA